MADPWTIPTVAARFRDAAVTSQRLPPVRVQGYASTWPALVREQWETLSLGERPVHRQPPSPQAIERMLQTMQWVQWLDDEDRRHLIWMRAKRDEWKDIAKRFGCDRTTAWRRWQQSIAMVAAELNAKGIVQR